MTDDERLELNNYLHSREEQRPAGVELWAMESMYVPVLTWDQLSYIRELIDRDLHDRKVIR